jgi:heme-degrading monooxygenase HmoA
MYAVFREAVYPEGKAIHETPEFREFQELHARRQGYIGTVVADAGGGRYLTVTLWRTAENMNAAREALGPVVERTLNRMMVGPSTLLGTGKVVISDLCEV